MFTINNEYTVLDQLHYRETVERSQQKVSKIIQQLKPLRKSSLDHQLQFIVQQLSNTPYFAIGGMGEGDWHPDHTSYLPDALHVKQDPVYRLDGLDCQTFVQVAMALLYSHSLNEFEHHILKIAYGAAGNFNTDIVHYYNRNNFIDGDWNPINRKHGWIKNMTSKGPLADVAKKTEVTLTRRNWFAMQAKNSAHNIRVLNENHGPKMVERYQDFYTQLDFNRFREEVVVMDYVPKESIVRQKSAAEFEPNQTIIDQIPSPAVLEIVRDTRLWMIGNKNIKAMIGSQLSVSHMGVIYRQTFKKGELIYLKTTCSYNNQKKKICTMMPVYAAVDGQTELMFAHATNARPNEFLYYQDTYGEYQCGVLPPTDGRAFFACNRVESIPLFNYLADYQYGKYWYMHNPSLLGIHIEQFI